MHEQELTAVGIYLLLISISLLCIYLLLIDNMKNVEILGIYTIATVPCCFKNKSACSCQFVLDLNLKPDTQCQLVGGFI